MALALVQALSRCSAKALRARWRLSQTLHISSLPLGGAIHNSQPSTNPTARLPCLKAFHLSTASSSPDPNKPKSGLSSGLEVELFEMGMWSLSLGTLGVAIVGIFLANTDLCLTKAAQASLEYLEDADLRSTGNDENTIKAKALWEKTGAVVMAVRRPG